MNRVRSLVHADCVKKLGLTGKGITVAILDSGLALHPDFGKRVVGFRDFLYGKSDCYDDYGHGTHVAGILGGNGARSEGKYSGLAPSCGLLPIKVLDSKGNGNRREVLRALEWVIQNKERYGIRIVNISVGSAEQGGEDGLLVRAVEAAWDAGLVVVAAAGNMGPKKGSITSPGSSKKVITVGSSDDEESEKRLPGIHFGYSGRGPTASCIVKPEILAPGSGIVSCNSRFLSGKTPYTVKSGTSMATPVVSGAVALLLEQHPELTNLEVKMRIRECADNLGRPKSRQGWGLLNVERLLK